MLKPYEAFQLDVIAKEYERKGCTVTLSAQVGDIPYLFDALVSDPTSGQVTIIALVNASRDPQELDQFMKAFDQLAKIMPSAMVDLRSIDPAAPNWSVTGTQPTALPSDPSQPTPSTQLLNVWSEHASLIRSIERSVLPPAPSPRSILDAYNDLLASDEIQPPEDIDDAITLDLFQIYFMVTGAVQGLVIEQHIVDQLQEHAKCLRAQWASLRHQHHSSPASP